MVPQAVIFDLDGTLYDKSRLPLYLVLHSLKSFSLSKLKAERSVRSEFKGRGMSENFMQDFFARLSQVTGESEHDIKVWYNGIYMRDTVNILRRHYTLRPWVVPLFKALKAKGIKTAILSDYGWTSQKLEALGFDLALADTIEDAPSLGALKPCPEVFRLACKKLELEPESCIMVGDRDDTDGKGAALTGMQFVKIDSDNLPEALASFL